MFPNINTPHRSWWGRGLDRVGGKETFCCGLTLNTSLPSSLPQHPSALGCPLID